jgi:hypothetical protein
MSLKLKDEVQKSFDFSLKNNKVVSVDVTAEIISQTTEIFNKC